MKHIKITQGAYLDGYDGAFYRFNDEKGKLAIQFHGEDGVYSQLPRRPAKSLRDALKQVQHMYHGFVVTTN